MARRSTEAIVAGVEHARQVLDKLERETTEQPVERNLYRYGFRKPGSGWRYRYYMVGSAARRRLVKGQLRWPDVEQKLERVRTVGEWVKMPSSRRRR